MDPVLHLHVNCRVMLPANSNVHEGKANGSQATFQKLILKPNTTAHTVLLSNGLPVKAVHASDVDNIILQHSNEKILPQIFTLEPQQFTFKAKILKPNSLQTKGNERDTI